MENEQVKITRVMAQKLQNLTRDLIGQLDTIPANDIGAAFKGDALESLGRVLNILGRLDKNLKLVTETNTFEGDPY